MLASSSSSISSKQSCSKHSCSKPASLRADLDGNDLVLRWGSLDWRCLPVELLRVVLLPLSAGNQPNDVDVPTAIADHHSHSHHRHRTPDVHGHHHADVKPDHVSAASSQQQARRGVDASCRAGCSRPPSGMRHHRYATQLQRTQSKVPLYRRQPTANERGSTRAAVHHARLPTAPQQHGSTAARWGTSGRRQAPAHRTLHTANCTLHAAHCTLHTAHRTLHTAHCTPRTATAQCTLHSPHAPCPCLYIDMYIKHRIGWCCSW